MAYILQIKPRYRPRGTVSVYLMRGRLVARGWRRPGRDPRSALQLAQRGRLACASGFLKHYSGMVASGYTAGTKPNGRVVGAYQMALSTLMREHTIYSGGRWRVAYPGVQLAQGRAFPLRGLTAKRQRGLLHIAWQSGMPAAAQRLRIALYHESLGGIELPGVMIQTSAGAIALRLPKGFAQGRLHVWVVLEDAGGKVCWTSGYAAATLVRSGVVLWVMVYPIKMGAEASGAMSRLCRRARGAGARSPGTPGAAGAS